MVTPLLFPGLMWLVSLVVAYLAVHRLAIRNITSLRTRMQQFTRNLRFVKSRPRRNMPLEFREIETTWQVMAETVVRDAAELENIIHARTVLLKEVHHRVKNNLQVIASIISMNIRKASSPEARSALKDVQMRVMSIATVHRALYTTSTVGQVQADELLASIVAKTIEAGYQPAGAVRISTTYDPISLYPDQAVPLSLLAAEAVTNALKYIGRPAGAHPWIVVRLTHGEADDGMLVIENSRGTPLLPPEMARGTGLGANLIAAFARQMRGTLTLETADPARYLVRVAFPIVEFEAAEVDPVIAPLDIADEA
jgi:two-component sensor histidine kinase